VADVIARHYLDALDAVPDDGDAGHIRGQAITALTRAAERAVRTGAPARAAASYATAARAAAGPRGQRPASQALHRSLLMTASAAQASPLPRARPVI
jgi:hypothetical protein